MKDVIVYLVVGALLFAVFFALGSLVKNKCEGRGGQFVDMGGRYGCIYPAKK